MFVYHHQPTVLVLLLYVDDILLASNNPALIYKFISHSSHHFAMKDLGNIHCFLGVQVVCTPLSLFLSQHKCVSDLLKKFHLHTLKLVHTPCISRATLSLTDGELLTNPSEFWSMIGALQYLSVTRTILLTPYM